MAYAQDKLKGMFVHRDLKPQNIMITHDRVVKVTDFGIAKTFARLTDDIPSTAIGDETYPRLTLIKSGTVCGTPPYMSPEQCRGEKDIDARSDIYSFGCVLHEMLTSRYIFNIRTPKEFIYHHSNVVPKSPNVHKELDSMVMRCLQKVPGKRYHNFGEIEIALSTIYKSLTSEVVKPPDTKLLEAWELVNKGVSFAQLGSYPEAIEQFQKALRINPYYTLAHNNLGAAHEALGNVDEAIREYQAALRIDPDYADAHYNLGITYFSQDKIYQAIAEFKDTLDIDPDYSKAHYYLGQAYYRLGLVTEAIEAYQEALNNDPNLADAHHNLGVAYHDMRNLDGAITEYWEALKIKPDYAEAYYNLGKAYTEKGSRKEAIDCYKDFIRAAPPQYESQVKQANEEINRLREII